MNKFFFPLLIFTISSINIFGQNIYINYDLKPELYNVSKPLNLWVDFLNTKDDKKGSKYWDSNEVKKYGNDSYFLAENQLQFGTENFLNLLSVAKIKILSVREINEYYKITSLMEFPENGKKSNIQYIFHVYAKNTYEGWKLFNPLKINTEKYLNTTQIGKIRFHYPKHHVFNQELGEKQVDFLNNLSKQFEIPFEAIDYYFADTNEEIQKIRGFDFIIGDNGKQIPSGKSDPKNRIVYSSGLNEYYPHEFIHILLNPYFPNNHLWFNEGVATYFGMSRGKDLEWHLKRLNTHLLKHPEIDLKNLLELRNLDNYTDYRYVLGGYFIHKAYEKGGINLIKKMLNSGKHDEDFYNTIKKYLNIDRKNLNEYIRNDLKNTYK